MMVSNRNLLFQGSIVRCYVCFRESKGKILKIHGSWKRGLSFSTREFFGVQPLVFRGEGVRILLKYVDDPIDSTHYLEDLLENSFRFEV